MFGIPPSPGLRPPSPGGRGRSPCICWRNCEPQRLFDALSIYSQLDMTSRLIFEISFFPPTVAGILLPHKGDCHHAAIFEHGCLCPGAWSRACGSDPTIDGAEPDR